MTMHMNIDPATFSIEQKAAFFDRMMSRGQVNPADLLSDFSNTLARTIEQRLAHFRQPLFQNPTTGRTASSVHGVLKALGC